MTEKKIEHPRVTVERYLGLVDERDAAQRTLIQAEAALQRATMGLEAVREEMFKFVGPNVWCRVFKFDTRAVLVWWKSAEASRVEVLELE